MTPAEEIRAAAELADFSPAEIRLSADALQQPLVDLLLLGARHTEEGTWSSVLVDHVLAMARALNGGPR
ncbi:hypothetical protein ABZ953_06575 [Streptomyces sp. NPDC046465]|uniref:hypothetical protein n=1 Tax=Streptomyces sp. NPDC046465 TaxID=3155810 RepID=UPI0033FA698F